MVDILYVASTLDELKAFQPLSNGLYGNQWFVVQGIEEAKDLASFIQFEVVFAGDFQQTHELAILEKLFGHKILALERRKINAAIENYAFTFPVDVYEKPLSGIDIMCTLLPLGNRQKTGYRQLA